MKLIITDFDLIKSKGADVIYLKEENFNSCVGCFNCWLKTPGKCIFNDCLSNLPKKISQCDTYIIISKIVYGSYSSLVKAAIDRCSSYSLPFFQIVDNEIHHIPRYSSKPNFIFIGYSTDLTQYEERTFKNLVNRNSKNYYTSDYKIFIAKSTNEINTILENI